MVACYTDWSHRYFDEWYGDDPDRHPPAVRLVRDHLDATHAETVLDAGCGPASMLRLLQAEGRALHGFDLTPSMIDEAQKVLDALPGDGHRAWVGDASDPACYRPPGADIGRL